MDSKGWGGNEWGGDAYDVKDTKNNYKGEKRKGRLWCEWDRPEALPLLPNGASSLPLRLTISLYLPRATDSLSYYCSLRHLYVNKDQSCEPKCHFFFEISVGGGGRLFPRPHKSRPIYDCFPHISMTQSGRGSLALSQTEILSSRISQSKREHFDLTR